MKAISASLVKAQKEGDIPAMGRLLKEFADLAHPLRKVNAATVSDMPARFFEKLVFNHSDCWFWRGHVDALGYGRFPLDGENKAHRVSYKMFKGVIEEGKLVLHRCDNRQCVNPDHLFLGTQSDNMQDMQSKGRGKTPRLNGEENPMSKLTKHQAVEIREKHKQGVKQAELSRQFNVSPMTISRLVRNQSWI